MFFQFAGATDGYFSNGYGTKNKGFAGAGIAYLYSPFSAAINPAGLGFLSKKMSFEISVGLFNPNRKYTIVGAPTPPDQWGYMGPNGFVHDPRFMAFGLTEGTVESGSKLFIIPAIAFAYKLDEKNTLGLNFFGNGGMNTDYDAKSYYSAIIDDKQYGKVCNFSYHSGQYLPDWHPWESIKDFYVSKKETGGGREIVPFELTWIVDVLGFPKDITGFFGKTINLDVDIDDTYGMVLKFDNCVGSMIVDVVARYAVRHLIINLERGQIIWNWENDFVKLYDSNTQKWAEVKFKKDGAQKGYNSNIIENIYVEEIDMFVNSVKNNVQFRNTLDKDIKVLEFLYNLENN